MVGMVEKIHNGAPSFSVYDVNDVKERRQQLLKRATDSSKKRKHMDGKFLNN